MKTSNKKKSRSRHDLLVMLATYNEKKNIVRMLNTISSLPISCDILVVDDNSPDGTGKIVVDMIKRSRRIYLISRRGKLGVGSAHIDGIKYGYKNKYKKILTLDCDFSHDPKLIPEILKLGKEFDIVTTNRFKKKEGLETWALHRKVLTKVARFLIYFVLGTPYDSTGAFRLYNINKIDIEVFKKIKSVSYSFFWESMYLLWKNNFSITEKAIALPARTYGSSKMRIKDMFSSLFFLFSFFLRTIFLSKSIMINSNEKFQNKRKNSEIEWDKYWSLKNKKKPEGQSFHFYDFIANIYRKYLIRPNLDRLINKYFTPGSILIHAGCGSGEVDANIVSKMKIKAVDISNQALEVYKKNHNKNVEIKKASIFNLPFKDNEVDGIYNLGVMEHFSKEEIEIILKEFNRVTKEGGKIILFWPPVFGLSVITLHIIHFFMKYILKNNNKLHPEEPNKIKNKKTAFNLLRENGFIPKEWSFSIKDLFTYVILVGEKSGKKIG